MTTQFEVPPEKAKYGQIVAVKRTGEDAEGVPFPLCKLTCVIGRSEDADIRLHLASVSLKHCIISVDPESEQVILETFSTIIPSYLNENPLERNSKVPLKHGDVISVANRRFRFEYLPPNFTPKQVSVIATPAASQGAPKTPEPASQTTEISSKPPISENRPEIVVKIFTPVAKPPVTGILRRRSSITPALPTETLENTIVGTPNAKASADKAGTVNSDQKQPVFTSLKELSVSEDLNQTQEALSQSEAQESQASMILNTPAPKRVSFGPYLSPEQYDSKLPPVTPVKRGATPSRASLARSKAASATQSVIEEDEGEATMEEDPAEMESSDLFNTTGESDLSELLDDSKEVDTSDEKPSSSDAGSPDSIEVEITETPESEVSLQNEKTEADVSPSQAVRSPVKDSSVLSSPSLLLSPKSKPPASKPSPISSPEPQIKLFMESDSSPKSIETALKKSDVQEASETVEVKKSSDTSATEESSVPVDEESSDPIAEESSDPLAEEFLENATIEELSQDPAVIEEPVQEEFVSTETTEMETTQEDLFNETAKEPSNDLALESDKVPSPAFVEEVVAMPPSDTEPVEVVHTIEEVSEPELAEIPVGSVEILEVPEAEVSQSDVELEASIQTNSDSGKEDSPGEMSQLEEPGDVSASAETTEVPDAEISQRTGDVDTSIQTSSDSGKESSTNETNQVEETTETTPDTAEIPQLPVVAVPEVAIEESLEEAETTEAVPETAVPEDAPADAPTEDEMVEKKVSSPLPTQVSSTPTTTVNHGNQSDKKDKTKASKPAQEVKAISPALEGVAELFNTPLSAKTMQRRRLNLSDSTEATESPFRRSRRILDHNTPKQAIVAVRRLTDEQVSAIQTELRTPARGKPRAAKGIALGAVDPQTAKAPVGRPRKAPSVKQAPEDKEESKAGADEDEDKQPVVNVEEVQPKKRGRARKVSETSTEPDSEIQMAKQMKKTVAVVVVPLKITEIEETSSKTVSPKPAPKTCKTAKETKQTSLPGVVSPKVSRSARGRPAAKKVEEKQEDEKPEEEEDGEEVKETGKKASRGTKKKTKDAEELPVTKGKRGAKKVLKKEEEDGEVVVFVEGAPAKGRSKRAVRKEAKEEDDDLEPEEPAPKTRGNRRTKKVADKEEAEASEDEKPAPKSRAKRSAKNEDVQEEEGGASENEKPAPRSRAKRSVKNEDVREEEGGASEDEKPAPKSRAKRSAKNEDVQEEEGGASENEKPAPRSRVKRSVKNEDVREEEGGASEDEKPAPKSRAKRTMKKEEVQEEVAVSPPKRGRNLRQATVETPSDLPAKPAPKRGKGAKAKGATKNGNEEDTEIVAEEALTKTKPTRRTQKTAKAEESEEEELKVLSAKEKKAKSTKVAKKNEKATSEEAVGLDDVEMAHQHKGHAAHLHEEKLRSLEDSANSPRRVGMRRKVQIETPDEERPAPKRAMRSRK